MTKVVVRAMRRADVPAVVAMMKALIAHIRAHGEPAPGRVTPAKIIKSGFGRDRWFGVFVATIDGTPVGYALHHRGFGVDDAARVLYLSDLYVAPEARRLGVARALMAAMARECVRTAAIEVLWRVHAGNEDARAFYAKMGAKEWNLGTTMWWPTEEVVKAAKSRRAA